MKTEMNATEWRKEPRDREFRGLLIDTYVLPTIRCSKNGGQGWCEGEGIAYLAGKLGIDRTDMMAMEELIRDWHKFTGLDAKLQS